ncbi:hypothetical protein AEQU3_01324 [Aequorivita antarctica]|nr:hypothetical protein AEQU3_01324 [Aequorivita antarctica]
MGIAIREKRLGNSDYVFFKSQICHTEPVEVPNPKS